MSSIGLILANPGSDADESEASQELEEPVKALDLHGVLSDFNKWNQLLEQKGVTVSDLSICDSRLTREEALKRIWELFRVFSCAYVVVYLGHGQQGSGNWQMRDADVTLLDIESAWLQLGYVQHLNNTATIVCDCCYSGKWPLLAMSLKIPGLQIQSAVDGDTLARDSCPTFSHIFLRMQEGQAFPEQLLLRWKPLCFSVGGAADCTTGPLHLVGAERTASRLYLQRLCNKLGAVAPGQVVNISFSRRSSHEGSVFHDAVAEAQGSQLGKMVVEQAQHDPVPLITQIECSLSARRSGVASCLLHVMLRHLNAEQLDIVFEENNNDLHFFLLAHGFKSFYAPNLPSGHIRAGCCVLRPKKVDIAWNEVEFFEEAKDLFVQRFKQTYDRFSEADLGLEGTTKNVWLQQTIDREETLRSGCPDRYQWLIAYGQSYQARRKVLGLAILDVKLEADPPCCFVRQIAVSSDGQGLGVAKALVKAILDHCSSRGISEFFAVTRRINKKAQDFMKRRGFKECESKEEGYDEKYIGLKASITPGSLTSSPISIGPTREPQHRACSKSSESQEETKHQDNLKLESMLFLWDAEGSYISAKNLLVVAFLEAYATLSEEELGMQVSKREWLQAMAAKGKDPRM